MRDPLLGPLVVVAAGGTLVELLAERAVALPPVDRETAREHGRRAAGRRGCSTATAAPRPRTVDGAGSTRSCALGQLAVELGDHLEAVDVNPLVVGADVRSSPSTPSSS